MYFLFKIFFVVSLTKSSKKVFNDCAIISKWWITGHECSLHFGIYFSMIIITEFANREKIYQEVVSVIYSLELCFENSMLLQGISFVKIFLVLSFMRFCQLFRLLFAFLSHLVLALDFLFLFTFRRTFLFALRFALWFLSLLFVFALTLFFRIFAFWLRCFSTFNIKS